MSVVETDPKPLAAEPAAAAPVDSTPAPAAESSTETPAPAAPAAADAEATTAEKPAVATEAQPETSTEAPAPVAEATESKEEAKVEPIYSGALSYKVHHQGFDIKGLISGSKKRYFWFGEEAPITTQNLNTYLRGEKPKVAHPAAAWSSKTGKGLLYYVKHADDKANPAGVLLLADVTDVTDAPGLPEFSFKLDGAKHTFEAKDKAEASGWVAALKEKIEEAKALKEEVQNSTEYKDASTHLNKPVTAGLAAAGAAGVAAKKDEKESKTSTETPAETVAADKPVEKENKKPKSRSVSRGNKRQSIFGNILGKKDEVEEKKEEKAEDKEAKEEEETAAPVAAAAASETPAAATETKAEDTTPAPVAEASPAAEATEAPAAAEPKAAEETTPAQPTKAGKRGSIFGNFFEKVRSPTHEKKESEVAPTVPPKDETKDKELPAAPVEGETAAVPVIAEPATTDAAAPAEEPAAAAAPAAEEKPAPQPERKSSLFGKWTQKLRSPSSERTPVLASDAKEDSKEEAPVSATTEAAPAVEATTAPTTETKAEGDAPAAEEPKAEAVNDAEKKEEVHEKRKSSFFGSVKKDKAEGSESGEKKGLGGIFRNPSKLIKGNKEGKKAAAPAKVDEENKVSDEAPKLDEPKTEAPLDTKTEETAQTQSIGDVVPAAVQVGQPQTVSATA